MLALRYELMRRSFHRHPVAVLREKCGLHQQQFADLIGCSRINLQKIENDKGGPRQANGKKRWTHPLSQKLAQRIFHETGVSLDWLRAGDPSPPCVSGRGEPYTEEIYHRAQAEKKYYDRPHPWFQKNDALKCCARVVAILQSASKRKNYYMAMWKLGVALDALQKEFGQEPGTESTNKQVDLLKPLIEYGRTLILDGEKRIAALKRLTDPQTKRPSKKKNPRRS